MKNWSVDDLLSTSSAYWKGFALQAGVRLGVFTALNDEQIHLNDMERSEIIYSSGLVLTSPILRDSD